MKVLENSIVFLMIGLFVVFWGPRAQESVPADEASNTESEPLMEGGYMGSLSCRECHAHFHELWGTSFHGLAMQAYTKKLAEEQLTPQTEDIAIGEYSYHAEIRGEQGFVIEKGPEGEKSFPIVHAMGGKNVFYFLTPFERGRLQTLPLGYDVNTKAWFDVAASGVRHFPGRDETDEPVHWTDPLYSFNTSCYGCHVSQTVTNYDLENDSYNTTWVEPGINCETCHGPAEEHNKVCRVESKDQLPEDLKIIRGGHNGRVKFTADQQNSVCLPCHAKMSPLSNEFPPGDTFFNHYDLITLEHLDFYPDGRDLGENYTMTTWMMSPCVQSSELDCLKCHTSSGRYRFKDPEKANQDCTPCHQGKVDAPEPHTHHPDYLAEDGPRCISCHMPMTSFARMHRSDHSMRPPTPATSMEFGSPTACVTCHTDKDAAWADKQVREWHEDDYQAPYLYQARLVDAARKEDWSRLDEMLAYITSAEREEIVANSLVRLLRACPEEDKWPTILSVLKNDASALLRSSVAASLRSFLTPETVEALVKATRDEVRLVRVRAAASLATVPAEFFSERDRESVQSALGEYVASIVARPDDYTSHYNLGNLYLDTKDFENAVLSYKTSSRLRPDFAPPLVNASFAYNAQGQNALAEESLRKALDLEPESSLVYLNLAMLLGEQERVNEAEIAFRKAFELDPESAAAAYNLSVILAKDRPEEALEWGRKASELAPGNTRYRYTLAFFLRQNGEFDESIAILQNLIEQHPNYADAYGLLGNSYEELGKTDEAKALYQRALEVEQLPAQFRSFLMGRLRALESK